MTIRRLTGLGRRGLREQVAGFHHRENVRGRKDPARDLFVTHRFAIPTASIDTDAVFGSAYDSPVTFRTRIRLTGASPLGLLFEFSDSADGTAMWMASGAIGAAVGDAPLGANSTFILSALDGVGLEADIVFSVLPGLGCIALWVNGGFIEHSIAAGSLVWAVASGTEGSFASAPQGNVTTNVPLSARIAPQDFEVIAPLTVYQGQVPRQFPR